MRAGPRPRAARQDGRVGLFILLTLLLFVPGCVWADGQSGPGTPDVSGGGHDPDRPNVVLILTDDQRWDTMWAMPTVLSEIAGEGITFTNGFVVNPICCPSRASILTGRYSHSTGVYRDVPPHGGFSTFLRRAGERSTIATWLDAAGYRTALLGKYLNGYDADRTHHVPPGWDRWVAFTSERGNGGYFDYTVSVDGADRSYGAEEGDYSTDVLADHANSFIRTAGPNEPLFLYFAPNAPHRPATPAPRDLEAFSDLAPYRPPSFNEADISDKPAHAQALPLLGRSQQTEVDRFRRDQYRTLLAVDDAVDTILTALRDTDRLSNTLLVFTSDNGLLWGEHRWTHKAVAYQESIRVPMVVRYDPVISAPRIDDHLVTNLDLAPTFAAASGVAAPGAEGRSLLPLLSTQQEGWRSSFLIEHLRDPSGSVPTYCALRTARYTYVAYRSGEEELYDLDVDVFEIQNVAADPTYAPVLAASRARLRRLCTPAPPGYSVIGGPSLGTR
jgi:arylsulfatase A-like enzyme